MGEDYRKREVSKHFQFIRGEAFGDKEPQPDMMTERVKCIECYNNISQGHSLTEVKKTCVNCHEARCMN